MSTPVNIQTTKITRGQPVRLGILNAANTQCVQFTIPEPTRDNQGFMVIQSTGTGTGLSSPVLEGSIDGGQTWFVLSSSVTIVLNNSGQLTGDAPPLFADAFQVNGMGAGCLFRYGYTAGTAVNVNVWASLG